MADKRLCEGVGGLVSGEFNGGCRDYIMDKKSVERQGEAVRIIRSKKRISQKKNHGTEGRTVVLC